MINHLSLLILEITGLGERTNPVWENFSQNETPLKANSEPNPLKDDTVDSDLFVIDATQVPLS